MVGKPEAKKKEKQKKRKKEMYCKTRWDGKSPKMKKRNHKG